MSEQYTEQELQAYFGNRTHRHQQPPAPEPPPPPSPDEVIRKRAWTLVGAMGGLILLVGLGIGIYLLTLLDELPSIEQLENPDINLSTIVYTADGELLTRFAHQDRTPVPLDSVSHFVVDGLVATEDYRFYDHWGFDPFRFASAVVKTLSGDRQGGSTITQQLARNLYKEVGNETTITRKLKELMTAIQIERNYTKREILEMYLNTVPFGYNTYGIATASQTYFNKNVKDLSLPESALLIGMLKGTSLYNPRRHPERATRRRNTVINQMVRFGDLPADVAQQAKADTLKLDFSPVTHTNNFAPYFAEHVRLWMRKWAEDNGYDLYTDGLVVHTTLDSRMQRLAQTAVARQLKGLQAVVDVDWSPARNKVRSYFETGSFVKVKEAEDFEPFSVFWQRNEDILDDMIRESGNYRNRVRNGTSRRQALADLKRDEAFMDSLKTAKSRLEAGFVAVDPTTRHIKAWVGGRDYTVDKYDHVAIAKRQPGSTFKPFLYTAAIDNGYSPYYTLLDDSVTIEVPGSDPWSPGNSGKKFSGRYLTLRQGLSTSTNSIAARLVSEIGGQQVANYARLMGVSSTLEPVFSLALGTSDVSLYELANAYATLASGGLYGDPVIITRIENRSGTILDEFFSEPREVLSESTTYTVLDMMRATIDSGTGRRVRGMFGVEGDFAGKTGTTQGGADGWFMLMHPNLVMGSWVGFNDRRVAFRSDWWGQGAHNALFVVGDFMKNVLDEQALSHPNARFTPPEGYMIPLPLPDANDATLEKKGGDKKGRIGW